SCGFWEMDNFNPMLVQLKAMSRNMGSQFAGALLRPHIPALKGMAEMGMPLDDILTSAKEAGRQLVEDGRMSPETLTIVSRELLPLETYLQFVNYSFQKTLNEQDKEMR
ncbi:MAG: flavodoxin family protein, partial [Proteobacteria bacterium]|nr:flavodoxin family protein [Pseudomonadota bacterium]